MEDRFNHEPERKDGEGRPRLRASVGGRGGGRGLRVVSRHPCEQVGKQASGRAGKQAGEPGRYGEARRATATASAARFPGIRLGVSGEQVFRFALPLLVSRFLFPFLFVPGAPYGVPASTASPVATTQREETFFLADVGAAYGPTWPSSWYSCLGSYRASGTRPRHVRSVLSISEMVPLLGLGC